MMMNRSLEKMIQNWDGSCAPKELLRRLDDLLKECDENALPHLCLKCFLKKHSSLTDLTEEDMDTVMLSGLKDYPALKVAETFYYFANLFGESALYTYKSQLLSEAIDFLEVAILKEGSEKSFELERIKGDWLYELGDIQEKLGNYGLAEKILYRCFTQRLITEPIGSAKILRARERFESMSMKMKGC